MNLNPAKIFQLPVIGDVLAYAYLGPKYISAKLTKILTIALLPVGDLRLIKRGTTFIMVPENKEAIVKEGIGLLQLCDPDMFSRLMKGRLYVFYIGTSKAKIAGPSNRVFGLHEKYIKWGPEGVAMFFVRAILMSEEMLPFNIFKWKRDPSQGRKILEWMRQHSFSPAFINSYRKAVEKQEQAREQLSA